MSNVIALARRRDCAPTAQNGKVKPPIRRKNAETRTREYLTGTEIEKLLKAAGHGRHGHRDMTLVMVMFRHGLRVSEAIALRWDQVDLKTGLLAVTPVKGG